MSIRAPVDFGWVQAAHIFWNWAQHSSRGATARMEAGQVSSFFPKMGILLSFGWETLQTGEYDLIVVRRRTIY